MPGDIRQRGYSEAMFDWLEVRELRPYFPTPVRSTDIIGEVNANAAQLTGLRVGTPVVAGCGDVPASALGVGALEDGDACCLLGTNILTCLVTSLPLFEPPNLGLSFCLPSDRWLRAMVTVAGTINLDWAIRAFFSGEEAASESRAALFAQIEALAQTSPIGSRGVLYLPYLSAAGIISPHVQPQARAQFSGMTPEHERVDLLRAVYEGVALSIRDSLEVIPSQVRAIRLSGGGARSAFWSQMIADSSACEVIVPQGQEFGARGAAALGAVALGWYPDLREAVTVYRQQGQHFYPQTQAKQAYDTLYRRYVRLRESLTTFWERE
jgi:sugar (pentulose or hexulose) kinase